VDNSCKKYKTVPVLNYHAPLYRH